MVEGGSALPATRGEDPAETAWPRHQGLTGSSPIAREPNDLGGFDCSGRNRVKSTTFRYVFVGDERRGFE